MEILIISIIIVVVLILLARFFLKRKMKSLSNVESNKNIIILSDKNFANQLKGKTVLVDFWAEWCMPCKMMLPILNDLSDDLPQGYFVGKLDVDKNQPIAQKFGVRSIPTLILFKNGKEVKRFVGIKRKDFLKKEMLK